MYRPRNQVTGTYQVPPDYVGLVIGQRGAGMRALQELPGVLQVRYDPRRGVPLTVTGRDEAACQGVWEEVERRIARVAGRATRMPVNMTIFHDIKKNQKVVFTSTPYGKNRPCILQKQSAGKLQAYHLLRVEEKGLESMMEGLGLGSAKGKYDWVEYSERALAKALEKGLDIAKKGKEANTIEFNISPGKLIILGGNIPARSLEISPDSQGVISSDQLKKLGVTSSFNPLLDPSVSADITKGLQREGFVCLNINNPEKFTIVHLQAGPKRVHFSVTLALDDNLEELTAEVDSRLDDHKKKAMEKVLQAKTIGEVLDGNLNTKIAFRKLSLLIHPDKNSHPGATEAFKKLNHACEEINRGKWPDCPALQVHQSKTSSPEKPPKVVSVKTKKRKISNITFFSGQLLDIRASITVFEEDIEKLTDHVKDVLNSSWESRDKEGGILTPGGDTGLYIQMIKQVKIVLWKLSFTFIRSLLATFGPRRLETW